MSVSEFDLINKYFNRKTNNTIVDIGDDAAVLSLSLGSELLVSVDTMVAGTHFLLDDDAFKLGHKLLAVNLSDIAAMGGVPKWATLALTLPSINETWLKNFSAGLFSLAKLYDISLIGGDTTKGDIVTLSLQIMGEVKAGKAIKRSTANSGDLVYISGSLGAAAYDLVCKLDSKPMPSESLELPQPQVKLGQCLQGVATSMIDISDGLLADVGHIANSSKVEIALDVEKIQISDSIENLADRYKYALTGGEDYQLCFTINPKDKASVDKISQTINCTLTQIGVVHASNKHEVTLVNTPPEFAKNWLTGGFQHFS